MIFCLKNIFRYFRFSLVLWDPNIYNEHFNLTINSPSSDRLSPVVRLSIYSPNPRGQFQLELVQSILDWILYKWKTTPFSSRNNYEMPNIYWRNFKIFNRTTVPVSTKLGEMHPFGGGIQVCSNEGPRVLWGEGINNKLAKKSYPPEPLGKFQQNLTQHVHVWRPFKFIHKKGRVLFQGEIITK